MTHDPLRRPGGRAYKATLQAFKGVGTWSRSCGRCGKHYMSAAGDKKHPILGYVCHACRTKKESTR